MQYKYMELFHRTAEDLMVGVLPEALIKCGYKVTAGSSEERPNAYLFAEGNIPILLVAHTDTVYPTDKRCVMDIIYDKERNIMINIENGVGLGADDRAGVAAILEIISTAELRPHILFLNYEEPGCIGDFVLASHKFKFPEIRYIIEFDRQGEDDCVFYQLDSPEFFDYVQNFGFKQQRGSYSDIAVLMPYIGCAGVNVSTGYFLEHRPVEFFNVNFWEATVERVKNMLKNPPQKMFPFVTNWELYDRYIYMLEDLVDLMDPYKPTEPRPDEEEPDEDEEDVV